VVTTDDGGRTWSAQGFGDGDLSTVSCSSSASCVALGSNEVTDTNQTYGLSSTDGGATWGITTLASDTSLVTGGVDCLTAMHCIAVGSASNSGYASPVQSTSDGGMTWHPQHTSESSATLESVACVSPSSCWAVGSDSNGATILHTVTGGEAWPSVTGVSPSQGSVTGGTTVTITGIHFDLGVTSISFGSATTRSFTLITPTELTVTAPSAPGGQATTVDVQVNTGVGSSPLTSSDQFSYTSG